MDISKYQSFHKKRMYSWIYIWYNKIIRNNKYWIIVLLIRSVYEVQVIVKCFYWIHLFQPQHLSKLQVTQECAIKTYKNSQKGSHKLQISGGFSEILNIVHHLTWLTWSVNKYFVYLLCIRRSTSYAPYSLLLTEINNLLELKHLKQFPKSRSFYYIKYMITYAIIWSITLAVIINDLKSSAIILILQLKIHIFQNFGNAPHRIIQV